ncbi:MAG: C_GCAxxG_C_C family protein [Eubacterium sp.]|nr:C_GCAxxG_C_C family protein [Eubacterium sp.]
MEHAEKAKQLFMEGYNCAQAVLMAFEDVTGLDRETAAKLASSFGGGMGRMREVCGAVSGALMVLGLVEGYEDPKDPEAKKKHYERVQDFAARFREENGSIICRELLTGVSVKPGNAPEERTDSYYKKRPCPELVALAAGIVDRMFEH